MGLFDRFRKPPPPVTEDPDTLRDLLFDAVGKKDSATLRRLADARADLILASFPSWMVVPEEHRADPAYLDWAVQGVVGVARHFARERQDDRLQALLDRGGDDPIARWQTAMEEVDGALVAGDVERAERLLHEQLEVVREFRHGSSSTILAMTLGRLASARFHAAPVDDALEPLTDALELCREAEDLQGEHASLGSMAEVFRYLGEWDQAADCLEEQAEIARDAGAAEAADELTARAAAVRAGEPLVRVATVLDGREVDPDALPRGGDLRLGFVFLRNRPTLAGSVLAVQRGMGLGSAGRFEEALAAFAEAERADPLDPQPSYQAGVTHMLLGRPSEALAAYERTERLAPGWYHVRSGMHLAREVAEGRLPAFAVEALHASRAAAPPEERIALIRAALTALGGVFPNLQLRLGEELVAIGEREEAARVWRAALDADPEPDVRTRLLAQMLTTEPASDHPAWLSELLETEGGNLLAQMQGRVAIAIRGH